MENKEVKKSNISPAKKPSKKLVVSKTNKVEAVKKDSNAISEVTANARFIRVAPRKVRLVIDQLRGLEAEKALDYLKFVNKAATKPVTKLINSAVANADNNFQIEKKDLYIKKIIANDGPVLKRWSPRAHGRATMIRKKTSHIELILGVRPGAKQKIVKKEDKKDDVKIVKPQDIKKEAIKTPGQNLENHSGGKEGKGFLKGMFQRKTG
jgi:large subunit ribosomal protein L22